jgi:hypothetical protein
LRDGLAAHDQELGLGPEGPAVAAITSIVRESVSAANTSGLLAIHTVDVGAIARRVVRAHLVALETHHLALSPTLSPR